MLEIGGFRHILSQLASFDPLVCPSTVLVWSSFCFVVSLKNVSWSRKASIVIKLRSKGVKWPEYAKIDYFPYISIHLYRENSQNLEKCLSSSPPGLGEKNYLIWVSLYVNYLQDLCQQDAPKGSAIMGTLIKSDSPPSSNRLTDFFFIFFPTQIAQK